MKSQSSGFVSSLTLFRQAAGFCVMQKNTKEAINYYWTQQFEFARGYDAWFLSAYGLKRAADSIFKISKNAALKEFEAFVKSTKDGTFKNGTHKLSSRELKLRLESNISGIYFLLMGFAIENVLKGILVSRNPQYININGIDRNLKTHNLVLLAQKCGFRISKKEREVLLNLSRDITWRKRYPIPVKLNEMISKEVGICAANVVDTHFPNHAAIEELFERLTKLIVVGFLC